MRTAMCLYLAETEICAQSLVFSLLSELTVKHKINNVYRDTLKYTDGVMLLAYRVILIT